MDSIEIKKWIERKCTEGSCLNMCAAGYTLCIHHLYGFPKKLPDDVIQHIKDKKESTVSFEKSKLLKYAKFPYMNGRMWQDVGVEPVLKHAYLDLFTSPAPYRHELKEIISRTDGITDSTEHKTMNQLANIWLQYKANEKLKIIKSEIEHNNFKNIF